jgi:serine/threonine protein phosphatase PrpC
MNPGENRIWCQVVDGHLESHEFCGGNIVGFSERSPDKTTPNEDAAAAFSLPGNQGVLAVADGMGGGNAGDQAAKVVMDQLRKQLNDVDGDDNTRTHILDAIERANEAIIGWGSGAGATVAVVQYFGGYLRAVHVGDAMALICSNHGRIKFSTVAHSPIAMAVEIGVMDESEAIEHEERHLVSNFVGSREMRIEIGPKIKMAIRDTLIVSSDGLFDNFLTDEIVAFIRAGDLQRQAADVLVQTRRRMTSPDTKYPCKPDDVTVLCFRRTPQKTHARSSSGKRVMSR